MDVSLKQNFIYVFLIAVVCFLLFYRPLFSGLPLGLDALGHLSKISYLKIFPFADWDMAWYSGTLFLKLYAPLFYYVAACFPNSIFGVNFLSFLSILLCSIGIYFYVNYLTKDRVASLFSGLSFLSVLSISFYYIGVGNHPWVASLWTLPFSLYFLEKTLKEKKRKYFVLYSLLFSVGILTHVLVGFLIGISMMVRMSSRGLNLRNIKKMFILGIIPVLVSSFWFFPFLMNGNNFSGGYTGVVPSVSQLFGFDEAPIGWATQVGGIGILIYFFILVLFLYFIRLRSNKNLLFLLLMSLLMFFLLFGGLLNHYPYGVSPVRFVLPLSIFLSLFVGVVFGKIKLLKNKKLFYLFFSILIMGLIWNGFVVNENYEKYSYNDETSRYGILADMIERLPIADEYNNYRFGNSHFVFGETINYFYPKVSQTFGYQDAGMLNGARYYDMRWNIFTSENINDSFYWLDWFGIKYFEVPLDEEYLDAKQILTLVENLENSTLGEEKEFDWERVHPDKAIIRYNSIDGDDVVVFKEFYHKSWRAKDLGGDKLEVMEVGPGFMAVYPDVLSEGVEFYQTKTIEEYIGYLLTILGLIVLFGIFIK